LDVGEDARFAPELLTIRQRRWFTEPVPFLLRDFVVETSLDGDEWRFVAAFSHLGEGDAWQAFPLPSGQERLPARFLRIRQTGMQDAAERYLIIGEIEFYGVLEQLRD
jgi:hypothetical protein